MNEIAPIQVLLLLLAFFCQPLLAFDEQAVFKKADRYYIEAEEPEKALELYRSIIEKGDNARYVMLSIMKIGFIYDQQLWRYSEAIEAYEEFLRKYPNERMVKIVKKNVGFLKALRDDGVLDAYTEYKRLEALHRKMGSNPEIGKFERMGVATQLHDFALANRNALFNKEVLSAAMSSLVRENMFLQANELLEVINRELPELDSISLMYSDVVEIQSKRVRIYLTACTFLGICLLVIIVKKGYRTVLRSILERKLLLLGVIILLFAYLILYYELVVMRDIEKEFDYSCMFFIWLQYILLVPFSIALHHSFSFMRNNSCRIALQLLLPVLVGFSSWIIFAHNFDYLWLLRL